MQNFDAQKVSASNYDIVICGGGIAGLWLLNVLVAAGFSVLLIEKSNTGGTQTMASQGMIHGGQRYMLGVNSSHHAESVAPLPERWEACLEGRGELDLRGVRVLSPTQLMWPAGGRLTHLALNAATHTLKAKMRKLDAKAVPNALAGHSDRPIYELPEKVLDIASLVEVLSTPHAARIRCGSVDALTRDGRLTVSGFSVTAQIVICAAGLGNENFLDLLEAGKRRSQQRPIRQIMVQPMPFPLYGHGVTTSYKPRITVTSHPLESGDYVWYLGGAIADEVLELGEDEAIKYAQKEMRALFEHIDWSGKKWATWHGTRAEAYSSSGRLPNGPVIQEYGNVLVAWPTKLTLTPLLGDQVLTCLAKRGVRPKCSETDFHVSHLALSPLATLPWERTNWTSIVP
jgi:glycine/D-amino acid oxidase-like deaminating enzyme